MNKLASIGSALLTMAAFTLPAEEFSLQFKTIPAADVMNFPAGYGASGSVSSSRPGGIKKEPRAVSRHPLYGQCRLPPSGGVFLARLDESKGDGKGYDQLIVDMNQNGDLTDDTVAPRVILPGEQNSASAGEPVLYGPIQGAADKLIAGGRPVFYAQAYLYNRGSLSGGGAVPVGGLLRLRVGWYLETTVELDGVKQKVGVYDADGNLRLGDSAKPQITRDGGRDSGWYFGRGDMWLVDANGSGGFENDAFQSESVPFGPILYLGSKVCKVSLAADCRALRVEPWSEALAEVALEPHGDLVQSVTLAWERQGGQWQLIRPAVVEGKLKVPPGNYRLYTCNLLGKAAPSEQVMVTGMEHTPRKPFSFVAGKANTLRCGAPLEVEVTATRARPESEAMGLLSREAAVPAYDSKAALRISTSVVGAGGEIYAAYLKGEKFGARPPKPTFAIQDARGNEVAHGDLEYG